MNTAITMKSGLLLVDKPIGMPSFEVVKTVRRKFHGGKTGHAGTLDAFASGLLILGLNEATKALSEIVLQEKTYVAEAHFGVTSSTDDPDGEKTILAKAPVLKTELLKVLPEFQGKIMQTPPLYSALKIRGTRASDRKRRGEDITSAIALKTRAVEVFSIDLLDFTFPKATLKVRCSSGTYIRALARDLGRRMGSGAYLTALRRISIGNFSIAEALALEQVSEKNLQPLQPEMFPFPSVDLEAAEEEELRFGRAISCRHNSLAEGKVSLFRGKIMIGFGEVVSDRRERKIQPRKLFRNE